MRALYPHNVTKQEGNENGPGKGKECMDTRTLPLLDTDQRSPRRFCSGLLLLGHSHATVSYISAGRSVCSGERERGKVRRWRH